MKRYWAQGTALLALLLWSLAFPALTLRLVLHRPQLYRRALRESRLLTLLSDQLTFELLRRVPEDVWIGWLPRSPGALSGVFDAAFEPRDRVEQALAGFGTSWGRWGTGDAVSPERLSDVVSLHLGTYHAHIAASLWSALPVCAQGDDVEVYCVPQAAGDQPVLGLQQRAWWDDFYPQVEAWLAGEESAWLATLPRVLPWGRWCAVAMLVAPLLMGVSYAGLSDEQRRLCVLLPLFSGGALTVLPGVLLWSGVLNLPLNLEIGTLFANLVIALLPPLWSAFGHLLGATLIFAGLLSWAVACAALLVMAHSWRTRRWALLGLLPLAAAALVWPQTALVMSPETALSALSSPTAWPTLTPTPTVTPTPTITPTPVVAYWPVSSGTPMPTPVAEPGPGSVLLACYQDAPEPVLALDVVGEELVALQSTQTSRRVWPSLALLETVRHPVTATVLAMTRSANRLALVQGSDLYVYTQPPWTRELRSRVSAFAPVESLAFVGGRDQLVLGLRNGYLWVTEPSTGGIVWLLEAHAAPVTALAAHIRYPYVLSGAEDGSVRMWFMDAGRESLSLEEHEAAVHALAFAPEAELAISSDAAGQVLLWNWETGRVLQRLDLAPDALLTARWTASGIIGTTARGGWLLLDAGLAIVANVPAPDPEAGLTTVRFEDPAYVVAGLSDGRVCVWGTLAPLPGSEN